MKKIACCIILLSLLLCACGTPASNNGASASNAAEPESVAVSPGGVEGNPSTELRPLRSQLLNATVRDGFFYIIYNVVPGKTQDNQFFLQGKLYFANCATRQIQPAAADNTLFEEVETFQYGMALFATSDRLILCTADSIESMNFDMSDRKTLKKLDRWQSFTAYYTDGRYVYGGQYLHEGGIEILKIDLTDGDTQVLYRHLDKEGSSSLGLDSVGSMRPLGIIGGPQDGTDYQFVYSFFLFNDDGSTNEIQFFTLSATDGTVGELPPLQAENDDLLYHGIIDGKIYWGLTGEQSVYQMDPHSGNNVRLDIGEVVNDESYYPFAQWDEHMLIRVEGRQSRMRALNLETKQVSNITLFELYEQHNPSSGLSEIVPWAEYEDFFIVQTGFASGGDWYIDGAGTAVPVKDAITDLALAPVQTPVFSLIPKDDYWASVPNYTPFTFVE